MTTRLEFYFGRLIIFHGHIHCENIVVIKYTGRATGLQRNSQKDDYVQDHHRYVKKKTLSDLYALRGRSNRDLSPC